MLPLAVALVGCLNHTSEQASTALRPARYLELRDDFEAKSLAAFWLPGDEGSGRYQPGAVALTTDFARSGRQSVRLTVHEGDVAQLGDSGQPNERAELDSGKLPLLGHEARCEFSLLIPEGFPIVNVRLVIAQWKQSGLSGSPVIAQRYVAGRHYLTIRDLSTPGRWRETYDLPDIVPGKWNDMVYSVRFANDSTGFAEVWMNGERVVRYNGPTASPEGRESFYHKVGLYRDRMAEPMTIYIDDYAIVAGGSIR